VDQLFNSSEKRLARILLLLCHFGMPRVQISCVDFVSSPTSPGTLFALDPFHLVILSQGIFALFRQASRAEVDLRRKARGTGSEAGAPIVNDRTRVILGTNRLSGPEFLRLLSSPCLDTCLSWDPRQVVPLVGCPVLIIFGTKDVQAPGCESAAAARRLAIEQGKSDWTIREFAGMNHVFQRCETGMPEEYASIGYVMADEVVEQVAAWIKEKAQLRGEVQSPD